MLLWHGAAAAMPSSRALASAAPRLLRGAAAACLGAAGPAVPWATPPSFCLASRCSSDLCGSSVGAAPQQQLAPEKQALLRQLLRRTHAVEMAMAHVLAGQRLALRDRPDAAWFEQQERCALADAASLLPRHRVRPSMLLPLLRGAGLVAGAAAGLAPLPARNAVLGALQEALEQLCNDGLRTLHEAGLAEAAPEVRSLLLRLRELQRAADGAPPPPGLLELQRAGSLRELGAQGALGLLAKAAADAAAAAAARL